MNSNTLLAWVLGASLLIGGCTAPAGTDPKVYAQQTADNITLSYMVVRSAAVFCTSGVLCKDEGVILAVKAGLATADIAIADAVKLVLANATDQSAVAKYAGIALAAIDVLTKALVSYGVKV